MGASSSAAMALLTVAVGMDGFIAAGEQSAMLDIANNFAGTLMGGINALGNTMGFVAPMIVGAVIEGHNDQDRAASDPSVLTMLTNLPVTYDLCVCVPKSTSASRRFQPEKGPSRGLLPFKIL